MSLNGSVFQRCLCQPLGVGASAPLWRPADIQQIGKGSVHQNSWSGQRIILSLLQFTAFCQALASAALSFLLALCDLSTAEMQPGPSVAQAPALCWYNRN